MSLDSVGVEPTSYGRGTVRICRKGKKSNLILVSLWLSKTRNALSDGVYEDLVALLNETSADDSVVGIVLTGVGPYFSSGADIRATKGFAPENGGRRSHLKPVGKFMLALINYPKLLCAAVNGPTVGIGMTFLMHCDLVHCSPTATFWAPFARLALVPEMCSSTTFIESMGLSKANELLLLQKKIDAATAEQWNIVSFVDQACDMDGDPFAPNSLACRFCDKLDQRLLQLPVAEETIGTFIGFVRGARRNRLSALCRAELLRLDERFDSGQVAQAASVISFGSRTQQARSKL